MIKYCKCGYPLYVEFFWNGHKNVPKFTDYQSGAYEFTHCPECGDQLRLEYLLDEPLGVDVLDNLKTANVVIRIYQRALKAIAQPYYPDSNFKSLLETYRRIAQVALDKSKMFI